MKTVGYVEIICDTNKVYQSLQNYLLFLTVLFFCVVTLGGLITTKINLNILKPLYGFADRVRKIANSQDYSIRIDQYASTELDAISKALTRC